MTDEQSKIGTQSKATTSIHSNNPKVYTEAKYLQLTSLCIQFPSHSTTSPPPFFYLNI